MEGSNSILKDLMAAKADGNTAFSKKDYPAAKKKYSYIMQTIKGLLPDGINSDVPQGMNSEGKKALFELQTSIYSNLCQTYIIEGNYKIALDRAEEGLKISPDHTKLLFKKAKILCELQQYDPSIELLKSLLKKGGDEEEKRLILIEIEKVKEAKKKHEDKHEQKFKGFLIGQPLTEEPKKASDGNIKLAY